MNTHEEEIEEKGIPLWILFTGAVGAILIITALGWLLSKA